MANLLDGTTQVSFPIAKVEETENGDLFVYGKATDDSIDSDEQIIDSEFARKGLAEWLSSGANVRVMHSTNLYPAGVGVEVNNVDNDGHWVKAEVVEPTAKLLVKKGVLRAFSVGISRPKIIRDMAAKGGRVVDGVFSEVSLVDRPANHNCRFQLVKRAKVEEDENGVEVLNKLDGDMADQYADLVAVTDTEKVEDADLEKGKCPACSGTGKDDDGDGDCDKCDGKGFLPKVEDPDLVKEKCIACDGSGSDERGICPKCEGKGFSGEVSAKSEEDVAPAPVTTEAKVLSPYVVKRLHDVVCPVFEWDAVKAEYPTLEKDGLAGTLGGVAKGLLYQMLKGEVDEDRGTGAESDDIHHIAGAYYKLCGFLTDETGEPEEAILLEARASLYKGFLDAQGWGQVGSTPDGIPKPSDPPQPGRFNRAFLSAGHYSQHASGKPRFPDATHTIKPGQFGRGNLSDGHESASPGNKGEEVELEKAQVASAKDTAVLAMADLHDHIAKVYPHLCSMGPDVVIDGVTVSKELDMADLHPVVREVKAAVDDPEAGKGLGADLVKALKEELRGELKSEYDNKIEELTKRLDEYESEPDPAEAPWRGALSSHRAASETSDVALTKVEAPDEDAVEREWLERLARSGNSEMRLRAQERLDKLAKV